MMMKQLPVHLFVNVKGSIWVIVFAVNVFALPSVFFLSCFKYCLFFVCSFHPKLQEVCKSLLNFYSVAKKNCHP